MQPSAALDPKIELLGLLEERARRKRENKLQGYQPYDFSSGQFQERDIIGLDDVTEYPSFEKMLKEPLEYTLY